MEQIEIILEQDDFKNNIETAVNLLKERVAEPTNVMVLLCLVHMYKHGIEQDLKKKLKKGKKYSVSAQGEGAIGDAIYFETTAGSDKIGSVEFDVPFMTKFGFDALDIFRATIAISQAA